MMLQELIIERAGEIETYVRAATICILNDKSKVLFGVALRGEKGST